MLSRVEGNDQCDLHGRRAFQAFIFVLRLPSLSAGNLCSGEEAEHEVACVRL
jgi:hypothetical protein